MRKPRTVALVAYAIQGQAWLGRGEDLLDLQRRLGAPAGHWAALDLAALEASGRQPTKQGREGSRPEPEWRVPFCQTWVLEA